MPQVARCFARGGSYRDRVGWYQTTRRGVCAFAFSSAAVLVAQEPLAPTGDREGLAARADRVERHGITWRFDQEYVVGTFANGDPWVLGPVRILAITPRTVEVDGRVLHGSMIDPDPSSMLQGYDSAMYDDQARERYRDDLNRAWGVDAEHPLVLAAPGSLVSAISRTERGVTPTLQTAAVLTCVAAVPAPDAFRPPFAGHDKQIAYREAGLDYGVLQQLRPAEGAPAIDTVAAAFERVWLDHAPEWPVRYLHPLDNMPDYGREIAATVGTGALLLNSDLSNERKRLLLVRMVQLGIDLHGQLRAGGHWPGRGGHGHGRKLPILLAGAVLHDARMLAVGRDFVSAPRPDAPTGQFFGEDGQTFFVTATAPGVWNGGHGGYTKEHDGLPEWGFAHVDEPQHDRAGWEDNPYRRCCTANGWVGEALAARMMGLQEAWNHPAFFAYMDRYLQVVPSERWHRAWVPWHAAMWDTYRANY